MPAWLVPYAAHPSFGGLLVPREEGFRAQRVVSRATADLIAGCGRGQPAPASLPLRAIHGLVLDGVLEARAGRHYLSGIAAHPLFFPSNADSPAPSALALLSLDALRRIAAFDLTNAASSARLLYTWNVLPCTPAWRARYPDPLDVERELRGALECDREGGGEAAERGNAWLSWHRTEPPRGRDVIWKLYVSPLPEWLGRSLRAAVQIEDAFSMKVGHDLPGILRPDKLVLYFASRPAMMRAARKLARELAGVEPHGVPFTGALADSPLLSWGVDWAGQGASAPWTGDQSWRSWLTHRLGSALAQAARDPGRGVPAWRFAMDRVSLDGVDVTSWSPAVPASTRQRHQHGHH